MIELYRISPSMFTYRLLLTSFFIVLILLNYCYVQFYSFLISSIGRRFLCYTKPINIITEHHSHATSTIFFSLIGGIKALFCFINMVFVNTLNFQPSLLTGLIGIAPMSQLMKLYVAIDIPNMLSSYFSLSTQYNPWQPVVFTELFQPSKQVLTFNFPYMFLQEVIPNRRSWTRTNEDQGQGIYSPQQLPLCNPPKKRFLYGLTSEPLWCTYIVKARPHTL